MSNSKVRAINKYNKHNTIQIGVRLNIHTDADVIEKLNSVDSKLGYIKRLIREDIAREGRE